MTDTLFALYPVFQADPTVRAEFADPEDRARATREIEDLFKRFEDRVTVRGSYSTTGFRADADLVLWLIAPTAEDVQQALIEFRRTELGGFLDLTWSFMGMVQPAEFSPDHQPAFVRGDAPQDYLCVYPFVRTADWYLLPPEERSAMLRDHGATGRERPEVLGNTTSAFGLGDWEWILAFESPSLESIVNVIRELRATEARRFTKVEVPFVTGIRKPIAACIDDLCYAPGGLRFNLGQEDGCYRAEMRSGVILAVIVLMVAIAGFLFWQSNRGYHGACVQIRPIPGAPWTRVPNDGHEYAAHDCSDDSRVG